MKRNVLQSILPFTNSKTKTSDRITRTQIQKTIEFQTLTYFKALTFSLNERYTEFPFRRPSTNLATKANNKWTHGEA